MPTRLTPLHDIVQMDPGAPEPLIVASDGRLLIAYWSAEDEGGALHVLNFTRPLIHKFGAPNDETLEGHPHYPRGLQHYAFAEVEESPWIEDLKAANRIHPHHTDTAYSGYRHFIGTFHDSTIEIVAMGYEPLGSAPALQDALSSMLGERLNEPGA